jgi:hypothetical protein
MIDKLIELIAEFNSIINSNTNPLYDTLDNNRKQAILKNPERKYKIILSNFTSLIILSKQLFYKNFPSIQGKYSEDYKVFTEILKELSQYNLTNLRSKINESKYVKMFIKMIEGADKKKEFIIDYDIVVFGCPTSTDIDVAVISDDQNIVEFSRKINEDDIKKRLLKLGYSDKKEIDLNVIYVVNKTIVNSLKGSVKETHGIIYYTQQFHTQEKLIDLISPDALSIKDKINSTVKFILDNLKTALTKEEYAEIREERKYIYSQDEIKRLQFVIPIFNTILKNFSSYLLVREFRDFIKSLFMKLGQTILIYYDLSSSVDYYIKPGIAKLLDIHFNLESDYSLYYLFRGNRGIYNLDHFKEIIKMFIEICDNTDEPIKWIKESIDTSTLIKHLPLKMQELFWKSPISPSLEFITEFKRICPDGKISTIMQIIGDEQDTFIRHQELVDKSFFVAQRSKEWFDLRAIYLPSGNPTNIYADYVLKDSWVIDLFHLIVGSIAEQYVMYNVDWSLIFPGYRFTNVGLIVYDKSDQKSRSTAPDGLLINDTTLDIMPVEIKCLRSEKRELSRDFKRELKLANLQLKEVSRMLTNVKRGILAFLYIHKSGIEFEYSIIDL